MTKPDKIIVYFAVFEFGDDASVVTEIMGVPPTRCWVKGQQIPGAQPTQKGGARHERWVLESRLSPAGSIETQIDDVLSVLESHSDAVNTISKRYRVALRVAAYFHDTTNPSWELNADVVQRLAALNLLVDFDIYCASAVDKSG